MRSNGLLEGVSGEHEAPMLNPAPEDIKLLMHDAELALTRKGAEHTEVAGEPILIVPGVTSHIRLPNLIPQDLRPTLTKMIMQAVDEDCARPPAL